MLAEEITNLPAKMSIFSDQMAILPAKPSIIAVKTNNLGAKTSILPAKMLIRTGKTRTFAGKIRVFEAKPKVQSAICRDLNGLPLMSLPEFASNAGDMHLPTKDLPIFALGPVHCDPALAKKENTRRKRRVDHEQPRTKV